MMKTDQVDRRTRRWQAEDKVDGASANKDDDEGSKNKPQHVSSKKNKP
jgi:hypothetical protein